MPATGKIPPLSLPGTIGAAGTTTNGPPFWPRPTAIISYGFRVPLVFVSAYTPAGYINNDRHDFGSILRFLEHNFGIREGALNFADNRATNELAGFYDLSRTPRPFQTISAPKSAQFFLHDKRKATDPDDDGDDH